MASVVTVSPGADRPRLMTYRQAARMVGVSERTLRRQVSAGRVPFRRVGRLVRFTDEDVAEIVAAYRVAPRARVRRPR